MCGQTGSMDVKRQRSGSLCKGEPLQIYRGESAMVMANDTLDVLFANERTRSFIRRKPKALHANREFRAGFDFNME
jgi:hypothetical protein